MASDESMKVLHDKASRGETLTAVELTCLEEWYAREDREEAEALGCSPAPGKLSLLRDQVQTALIRLQAITARLQAQAVENDALRREIADLQSQATHPQPVAPSLLA